MRAESGFAVEGKAPPQEPRRLPLRCTPRGIGWIAAVVEMLRLTPSEKDLVLKNGNATSFPVVAWPWDRARTDASAGRGRMPSSAESGRPGGAGWRGGASSSGLLGTAAITP